MSGVSGRRQPASAVCSRLIRWMGGTWSVLSCYTSTSLRHAAAKGESKLRGKPNHFVNRVLLVQTSVLSKYFFRAQMITFSCYLYVTFSYYPHQHTAANWGILEIKRGSFSRVLLQFWIVLLTPLNPNKCSRPKMSFDTYLLLLCQISCCPCH